MGNFRIIFVFVVHFFANGVFAVDESLLRERKVSEIDPDVDMKWMGSVERWYVPMWSKLDKVRIAADMYKKPVSELSEKQVEIPACITFDKGGVLSGFNKKVKLESEPIMQGSTVVGFSSKASWSGAIAVKGLFKLTDNEDFFYSVGLWEDGEASWAVFSTKPTLDEDDKMRILGMIKGLGFTEKMIMMESYENCKNLDKNEL